MAEATLELVVPDDWTEDNLLELVIRIRREGVRCSVTDHTLRSPEGDS